MRVLFSCRPGLGHFHPMVGLARALADAGHSVRVACPPDLADAVRSTGFDAAAVGLTGAECRERIAQEVAGWSTLSPARMRSVIFPRGFAGIEVAPRLQGLLAVISECRPELIVHEMAEFAAPLAAALEGVPSVNHSWGPLVAADVMTAAGASAAEHWRAAGLPTPDRGGMYEGLYLDVCPPSLQEPHIATVPRIQPMRPVPVASAPEQDASWLRALGRRPVVSVTLGTVFNQRLDIYQVVMEGLADMDVDVVVAVGPGVELSMLGTYPENAQVRHWVPWSTLLDKTTVMVSHGGASSSLGPLARGIPVVVLPLGADHFVNAERVRAAKAGVVLDSEALTPLAVRQAVEATLSAPLRQAATRIAEEVAELPTPGEVVPRLEAYARRSVARARD